MPWSVPGALILFYPALFEINSILQITTFWSCDTIYFGHASPEICCLQVVRQYLVHNLTQTKSDKRKGLFFFFFGSTLYMCIVHSITSRLGLRSMSPPHVSLFISFFAMPSSPTKSSNRKTPHSDHAYSPQRETRTLLPVWEIGHPHTELSKQ